MDIIPAFIPAESGDLFSVCYKPTTVVGYVLCVPPFAEEMNKSRHMITMQARALAEAGWQVLVFDFHGCGDSQGLLEEASLPLWRSNLLAAFNYLTQGQTQLPVMLWGLRLGVPIAVDWMRHHAECPVTRVLAWQPVTNGKQFMQQFLRLRLAASMVRSDTQRQTVQQLKDIIASEGTLEVAGYNLSATLLNDLEGLDLSTLIPCTETTVGWVDVVRDEQADAAPATRKVVDIWRKQAIDIDLQTIVCEPFWATQELVDVPEMIALSLQWLSRVKEQAVV
ncbi:hydrolase 2, exosortase A system-associated [Zooshikella ganghwensis]|uniref:hydrolase 2, exosortase A system-associated n=1 Tax=Zooshikella ganghwensis TaxID=202772 RepID=UPI0004260666|nr:hydrolase 2, exosortase A system-associated [Zooshikella ganghwensis]